MGAPVPVSAFPSFRVLGAECVLRPGGSIYIGRAGACASDDLAIGHATTLNVRPQSASWVRPTIGGRASLDAQAPHFIHSSLRTAGFRHIQ
jgi:hypothetical protein